MTLLALLPAALFLGAALVCLLLEAAGTPPGARKRGARPHLVWIAGLAAAGVVVHVAMRWEEAALPGPSTSGVIVDRVGLAAGALLALVGGLLHLAAAPALREADEERGEASAMALVYLGALSVAVVAVDLLVWTGAYALSTVAMAGLCAPDRDGPHGVEATAKGLLGAGLHLGLLGAAALLAYAAAGTHDLGAIATAAAAGTPPAIVAFGLAVTVAAACCGAFPLQARAVDVAQGASSSSAGLVASGALVAGGVLLLRLVAALHLPAPALATALAVSAGAGVIGLALAALAQTQIARMTALLVVAQTGVVLAALAALAASPAPSGAGPAAFGAIVLAALAGAAALLGLVPSRLDAASTWEDWAGYGRRRPVLAAFFVYALASVAGMPGTPGFVARLGAARAAFDAGFDILGVVTLAAAALAAAPVVRFALFLFGKEPRAGAFDAPPPTLVAAAFGLLVGIAAGLGFLPDMLAALLASLTL